MVLFSWDWKDSQACKQKRGARTVREVCRHKCNVSSPALLKRLRLEWQKHGSQTLTVLPTQDKIVSCPYRCWHFHCPRVPAHFGWRGLQTSSSFFFRLDETCLKKICFLRNNLFGQNCFLRKYWLWVVKQRSVPVGCEGSRGKLETPGAAVNYLWSRHCSLGPLIQIIPLQILAMKSDHFVCNSVLFSSEPHFYPGVLCGSSGG